MIHRYVTEGRKTGTVLFVLMKVIILGKLTWCSPDIPHGALLLEDTDNSHFDSFESPYSDESYNIKTPGCIIPAISFQNLLIRRLPESKNRIQLCNNYKTRLLGSNQTYIWIIKSTYKYYKINNASNLVCCYKPFQGPLTYSQLAGNVLDNTFQYLDCLYFDDIIEVNDEFVKVTCFYFNQIVYEQYYIFTPQKPFTLVREDPLKTDTNQSRYNVIIMGMGSTSRQNFHRTMRKTVRLMKKYNAVELKGYSTLEADETFHNMVAALTGMNDLELRATCLTDKHSTLDRCPFIWERFKDFGYYTALMEDTSTFSMFNRGKYGFIGRPTDYYVHPFMHEFENSERQQNKKSILNCMGDKYYFEVLLNYIHDLTSTLKNFKLFGVFWGKSMNIKKKVPISIDNTYVRLLKIMEATGYLNNTILIFMSDHGMDTADIPLITQAPIEQRQPFIFILMPPSFRKQYRLAYQNLKMNMGRLTTAFDVHKTLVDLIEMTDITKKNILKRSTEFYTHNRGISLFLKIPQNRTCEMAGISKKWCACYDDVILPTTSSVLEDAVEFINFRTNEILKPYPECLSLKVEEIITAKKMVPVYERTEGHIYNVVVRMTPGSGIFDIIFRYYDKNRTIIDHMERLNSLDIRSACVKNDLIQTFCTCI